MDVASLNYDNSVIHNYLIHHPQDVLAIWNRSHDTILKLEIEMNKIEPESFTNLLADNSVLLNLIAVLGILTKLAYRYNWYSDETLKKSLEDSISSKSMQEFLFDPIREVLPIAIDYPNQDMKFIKFLQNFELGNDQWFESVGSLLLHGQSLPLHMITTLSNLVG